MEQRKTRRFHLQLPVSITRSGAERVALAGITMNISSTGVLFTTGRGPDLGGPIEYIISLNQEAPQPVNLRCMGKVVRSELVTQESDARGPNYQVAATLERYEFVRLQSFAVASA